MQVIRVTIKAWRNLRDVDLHVGAETPLVCLVGENGTGKSVVLELLSAAAHQLGIAQGVEMTRGEDGGEVVSPPNIRTIRLRSTAHRAPDAGTG